MWRFVRTGTGDSVYAGIYDASFAGHVSVCRSTLAFRIADVYLCGSLVCGVSSSAIVVAACVQIAFNLGNAVGAYAGGLPIDAGLGYRYPALVGVFVVALGWVCVTWYIRRERRHFINEPIRL